ncbi:PilZ domain-containing protein [Aestuariivirga sp.]|uniref:PilZ domain-containing protein n=1 Tax=Aestuariivirga sp. TaxID=2650926 RepID=UPI00391D9CC8
MTTVLSQEVFHEDVGHAFNELTILQQIGNLPADSLLRVLQSIPSPLLRKALEKQEGSPAAALTAVTPPLPERDDSNSRKDIRNRVLRGGKVIYNNRHSIMDAQVRDLSTSGCRIRVEHTGQLPTFFTMVITGVIGEKTCETRWRTDREVGVRFL